MIGIHAAKRSASLLWLRLIMPTIVVVACQATPVQSQPAALPQQLSNVEFWNFIEQFSEPDGYFGSDNLVSNETMFQHVIPRLVAKTTPGHVYLGVGPEQNYTYIAALKPSMAIIVDIRRGNMHMHLLYKALFELSSSRAEFVSRMFSKPMPRTIDTNATAGAIFSAIWFVPTDTAAYTRNFREVAEHLTRKRDLPLTESDLNGIRRVYDAFYYGGPVLDYGNSHGARYPSFATLMAETDGSVERSFLATEANWRAIRDMHMRNMIVPIVGDFAGPKALRGVGRWLMERKATVQAFYVSNVEQYLFQNGVESSFYSNVSMLPLDANSMYIRGDASGPTPALIMTRPNLACSIREQLQQFTGGQILSYSDAMQRCSASRQ